jgi:uncharacterized protein YraI
MKAPTSLVNRPGRAAAVAGAVLAVSAGAAMAIAAGTASAEEPGRCTDNVNVREEPTADARIVGLCEAGKQVKIGERQGDFVRLAELGGWAAAQYVSVDGPAESPAAGDDNATDSGDGSSAEGDSNKQSGDADSASTPGADDEGGDSEDGGDEDTESEIGGLLG